MAAKQELRLLWPQHLSTIDVYGIISEVLVGTEVGVGETSLDVVILCQIVSEKQAIDLDMKKSGRKRQSFRITHRGIYNDDRCMACQEETRE